MVGRLNRFKNRPTAVGAGSGDSDLDRDRSGAGGGDLGEAGLAGARPRPNQPLATGLASSDARESSAPGVSCIDARMSSPIRAAAELAPLSASLESAAASAIPSLSFGNNDGGILKGPSTSRLGSFDDASCNSSIRPPASSTAFSSSCRDMCYGERHVSGQSAARPESENISPLTDILPCSTASGSQPRSSDARLDCTAGSRVSSAGFH